MAEGTAASKHLAGLVGPGLMAISGSEAMHMGIFAAQTAPVVYLNGTLLFVAGLAIVRAHNRWHLNWTVLLTLCGWVAMLLGLYRMFFPQAAQAGSDPLTYVMLAALFAAGAVLTAAAYLPRRERR